MSLLGVFAQKLSIYWHVIINTMDAEMQYFKMSSLGVFAQTCSIYSDVVIEYNRHRDAVFCDIITGS